jgi:ubiquinol-cytochrome c reductase cytochrome c subunit
MRLLLVCSSLLIAASLLGAQNRGGAPNGGAAPAASGQTAPAGNAENGKKIFSSYGCYQCHGFAAQGGAGARLGPRPIAFAAFSKYVRRPLADMPPYTAKVVSDQELADIYAFLLTIPQPPAANSIPILAR